ncbi:MAG TPA: TlpA disulfide reductase family protein [Balneolaceae bacterium]|nr:TlpA disulfide reductase family protein [Balneolaceae bacterium]
MQIDNKYFVPFILIVAIISAFLIAFFTLHIRQKRHKHFIEQISAQDSIKYVMMPVFGDADSLSVQSFKKKYVVVDFWATWTASFSEKAHKQLAGLRTKYPQKLEVIAAIVKDKPEKVQDYIDRYNYPFHYVEGTAVFENFDLPGIPTQLVYSPKGQLLSIFTGRADAARLDSLNNILKNG